MSTGALSTHWNCVTNVWQQRTGCRVEGVSAILQPQLLGQKTNMPSLVVDILESTAGGGHRNQIFLSPIIADRDVRGTGSGGYVLDT